MLSRRTLIASAAVLAAGCGPLKSLTPRRVFPRSLNSSGLPAGIGLEDQHRILATLVEDEDNPYGPEQGHYRLESHTIEQAPSLDDLDAWRDLRVDLLSLEVEQAKVLGEGGVLLPLDRFGEANESALNAAFFPGVLNQFRVQGALYALPVSALPVMAYYDVVHFTERRVPPMDGSWNWDDLVRHGATLTERGADGTVRRWGVDAHGSNLWWALWQNEAEMVDPAATLQCRLQESASIEALQFVHGLLHRHRVSPPLYAELVKLHPPPAVIYRGLPIRPNHSVYRLAEIPHGKVRSVPVRAGVGVGIAAHTEKPEAAYTALKGLVHAMQRHAAVPAAREAIERLGEFRTGLRPEEVTAIQRSMEAEREMPRMPQGAAELYTMAALVEGIVRGDDVSTVVNQACSLLREYQQTGGKTQE